MPFYVLNPTRQPLFHEPSRRVLRGRERVEVTRAQANATSRAIFVVSSDEPDPEETEIAPTEAIPEPPARATRQTVKRGTKSVEVNAAPETETR